MYLIHWIFAVLAILVADYLLPGVTTTLVGAIIFALVLAIINVFFKPIITLLTLPLTILTLGLFSLVVNVLLILLAAKIVPGVSISGFWTAVLFSIIISLVNTLFARGLRKGV
jgi:putative membrane protein